MFGFVCVSFILLCVSLDNSARRCPIWVLLDCNFQSLVILFIWWYKLIVLEALSLLIPSKLGVNTVNVTKLHTNFTFFVYNTLMTSSKKTISSRLVFSRSPTTLSNMSMVLTDSGMMQFGVCIIQPSVHEVEDIIISMSCLNRMKVEWDMSYCLT